MLKKIVLMLIPLLLVFSMFVGIRLTSAQETLKVGVIGPYYLPQWHASQGGMQGGAHLAAMEINATGGINIGGTTYYIKIIEADEGAYNPLTGTYDPDKARAEIQRLLYTEGCKFIIGGFRTEVTDIIIEETMDYNEAAAPGEEVFFFINGAATDWLIRDLSDPANYTRYKWLFRVNPINSTMLFRTMLGYLQGYLIPNKLALMYGGNVKYAVMVEDLEWTQGISAYLQYYGLGPNATFVYGARTPPGTTDFTSFLDAAESAGAHLLVIAYTLPDTAYLLAAWRTGQYKMIITGIDVFGQQGVWPDTTGGACDYEVEMDFSGTRTPIVPGLTDVFWDHFVGNYTAWPLYTAWGAYNALYSLKEVLEAAGTLDPSTLLPLFEDIDTTVLNGKFKYTSSHDVFSFEYGPTWPIGYTRAMMVQWINTDDGFIKNVVSPVDQLYSRKTMIPPWMYELADVDLDFSGKIDIKDIFIVASSFGSEPGHPRWNFEADTNVDGLINIRDIFAIASNFGRQASEWPLP